MSDLAISTRGLGKEYRLGPPQPRYNTLRDQLAGVFRRPQHGSILPVARSRGKQEKFWALRDIAFDLRAGEVLGVIGRNGAGKSTLLKILSRVTEPTVGTIDLYGRVASLLEVGTGFHPELSGRENIYLNGAILGMTKQEIDRKFDEIVAFAEVEKFVDTPVKHYSSGMYLRLAFAVSAHLEPEILIVDEVLAVGDISFQQKCLGKMQDVSSEGRTVLFVSHNMPAITSLCTRAIHLEAGRLVQDGPASEVVSEYLTQSLGVSAETRWDDPATCPGSGGFRLRGVSAALENGAPANNARVDDPIDVHLRYETTEPDLRFRIAVIFYTQGTCAFTSVQPAETLHARAGEYHTSVRVPAHLLAEGQYLVGVSVFTSRGKKSHLCKAREVVAFQVFDPVLGNSARGDYTENLNGVVRPILRWTHEAVGVKLPAEAVSR
jgi:lipopolysaccharide transport system ATP-binding protein